jgi:lipopolysaccharide transport system ATP-binding protein
VCVSFDRDNPCEMDFYTRNPGTYRSRCIIPGNLLNDRTFMVGINCGFKGQGRSFWDPQLISFTLDAANGIGAKWNDLKRRGGVLRPDFTWTTENIE